jgi:hypothetical protein
VWVGNRKQKKRATDPSPSSISSSTTSRICAAGFHVTARKRGRDRPEIGAGFSRKSELLLRRRESLQVGHDGGGILVRQVVDVHRRAHGPAARV